jgi:hypothetical protein
MPRWLDKVPHARFKTNFPSALSANEEISGLLESHLRARFGAAAPDDMPMPWDKFRGRNAVLFREELMLVSRDIHALLDSATGISTVMWYFDDFRRQGRTSVWTPEELPLSRAWCQLVSLHP